MATCFDQRLCESQPQPASPPCNDKDPTIELEMQILVQSHAKSMRNLDNLTSNSRNL